MMEAVQMLANFSGFTATALETWEGRKAELALGVSDIQVAQCDARTWDRTRTARTISSVLEHTNFYN
jgi:hypothetical protein